MFLFDSRLSSHTKTDIRNYFFCLSYLQLLHPNHQLLHQTSQGLTPFSSLTYKIDPRLPRPNTLSTGPNNPVARPRRPVAELKSWAAVASSPVMVSATLKAKEVRGVRNGRTRARTAEISGVMRVRVSIRDHFISKSSSKLTITKEVE